jgi:asparagine synthetase B (glutamine-hydrolysing)
VPGIFGLIDLGDAVDEAAVERAAGAIGFRGAPALVAERWFAVGAYGPGDGREPALELGDRVLVVDGWLYADPTDPDGARPFGAASAEALASLVVSGGPAMLDGLPADLALALVDRGDRSVLLTRDALGLRPLFWARRGSRIGFASDPEVLIALGVATGALDREVARIKLAIGDPADGRTSFAGVSRVGGGRWLRFDRDGAMTWGRWFRPERILEVDAPAARHADRLRDAVIASAGSRAARERVALSLSGGRDSGSMAIALSQAGVRAAAHTIALEGSTADESTPAQELAEAMGHGWRRVDASASAGPERADDIVGLASDPFSFPVFPSAFASRDAPAEDGCTVLLDGEGGDDLFAAPAVAALDLARRFRLREAVDVARRYRSAGRYTYRTQAKAAVRAVLPSTALGVRERARRRPPWLFPVGMWNRSTAPRSSRDQLLRFLLEAGLRPDHDEYERLYASVGVRYAGGLLDARVVRVALQAPVSLRAPRSGVKGLLGASILGGWDATRVDDRSGAYVRLVAERAARSFHGLLGRGMLSADLGLVDREGIHAVSDPRWWYDALRLVRPELWLRARGDIE